MRIGIAANHAPFALKQKLSPPANSESKTIRQRREEQSPDLNDPSGDTSFAGH